MIKEPLIMSDELYNAILEYQKTCSSLIDENPRELECLTQIKQSIMRMPNISDEYRIVLANTDARINELNQNAQLLRDLCMPYFEKVVELANSELSGKLIYNTHYGNNIIFAESVEVDATWIRVLGKVFNLDALKLESNGERRSYGIYKLIDETDFKRAQWSVVVDEQYLNKMITDRFNSIRMLINTECCNLANKK